MNKSREEGSMGATSRRAPGNGAFRPEAPAQPSVRRSALTTNDALVYLREVKQRFHTRKDVYDSFLDVMKDFKAQRIDIATVIKKVKELLKGHSDLILGFNTFLPKGSEITLSPERREARPAVELDQAITYINKIKARFANDERVYKNFLEILCCFRQGRMDIHAVYREVADLFRTHEDLLEEFGYFLPDHSGDPSQAQELLNSGARAMAPLSSQSNTLDAGYPRRRSARTAQDARRVPGTRDQLDYERELRFFDDVKLRLGNRAAYADMLKCINLYAQDVISKAELVGLVQDVVGRHPEVMSTFRSFISSCPGLEDELAGESRPREQSRANFTHIQRRALIAQRNKYLTRPVSELDTSALDRPTTSYVRLPRDYPVMKCSGRTAVGEQVLQDELASVTTGTEDTSFKHMRKNQYEENLFRSEDERYDLEQAIERNISGMKVLRPFQEQLANMSADEKTRFTLPELPLNPIHCRIIERIYGDKGKNVLDLLVKNPVVAIPVVLSRMEQKDQEWRQVRDTMNSHWKAVFAANYHKSLDHRSFYFKQADKKNLAPKQLLLEIKEAADKCNDSDRKLQALSAACSLVSALQPHLSFGYSDKAVHEDVYQVVRFAASKTLSADAYKQAMSFWTNFVEPFFGIAPHDADTERSGSMPPEVSGERMPAGPANDNMDVEENGSGAEERDGGSAEASAPPTPQSYTNNEVPGDSGKSPPKEGSPDSMVDARGASDELQAFVDMGTLGKQQDPSQLFGGCRPLASMGHKAETQGNAEASGSARAEDDRNVLYCNEAFYIFLRLHHYLFERLENARKCCRPQERGVQGNAGAEGAKKSEEQEKEAAEKVHKQFMGMVYQLVDGRMEMSQFEDTCRSLLSTNSYVLFTLDKLIIRLIKQLQTLVQDDISVRIWNLYKYEKSRCIGVNEEMYYINCKVVLRDDQCYRVERGSDGKLTMQLMAGDIQIDSGFGALKPGFAEYLKGFLGEQAGTPTVDRDGFTPVMLQRNLPVVEGDPAEFEAERLRQFFVDNGLECKLSCESSKLKYVLDTEDVLVRKRKAVGTDARDTARRRRAATFQAWLKNKTESFGQQSAQLQPQMMGKSTVHHPGNVGQN